jgi:NAD-dependent SIR2 family protein deacetylase
MANEKRLIDANALLYEYCQANGCNEVIDEVCPNCFTAGLIANAPTVDAVEVVHGRWNEYGNCSACGKNIYDDIDADMWSRYAPPYCPNCGARMDLQ